MYLEADIMANLSVGQLIEFFNLELEIFQENEMSAEKAHEFYDRVICCQLNFATLNKNHWEQYPKHCRVTDYPSGQNNLDLMEYVDRKFIRLQKYLRKFFEPVEKLSSAELKVNYDSSGENDQSATSVNLNSLLQKQKFYIQMIDSLKPEGELSSKEAELRYEHVSQAYEKFISNQSEITTLVKDTKFDDQVAVFKDIQREVLSLQETLKEIFSPTKPTVLPKFKVNEHFDRTDRPNVIVDFLDSQYKKQKSLIEQIELIESKNDSSAAEAETLHNHVSQLHDTFVKNQAKIETYVSGSALDEELKLSGEVLRKVMALQTKLKEIFAPVQSPYLVESRPVDEFKQMKESDKIIYLNWLLEKQKSLISEIELMSVHKNLQYRGEGKLHHNLTSYEKEKVNSLSTLLSTLKKWFFENQTKIEELVDDFDLYQQKKISTKIQEKLTEIENQYVSYMKYSSCTYYASCLSCRTG